MRKVSTFLVSLPRACRSRCHCTQVKIPSLEVPLQISNTQTLFNDPIVLVCCPPEVTVTSGTPSGTHVRDLAEVQPETSDTQILFSDPILVFFGRSNSTTKTPPETCTGPRRARADKLLFTRHSRWCRRIECARTSNLPWTLRFFFLLGVPLSDIARK